jgi:hypothetical protein
MIDTSKIIYSINIEDVQNVAEEELGRKLSKKELEIIEDKLGDYIDWYSAIEIAIRNEKLNLGKNAASDRQKNLKHHDHRRH